MAKAKKDSFTIETFINNNCKNGADWRYTSHSSCKKQILRDVRVLETEP